MKIHWLFFLTLFTLPFLPACGGCSCPTPMPGMPDAGTLGGCCGGWPDDIGCPSNANCNNGICTECGLDGGACCTNGASGVYTCQGSLHCTASGTLGWTNICQGCGNLGEPCCSLGSCPGGPGLVCTGGAAGTCVAMSTMTPPPSCAPGTNRFVIGLEDMLTHCAVNTWTVVTDTAADALACAHAMHVDQHYLLQMPNALPITNTFCEHNPMNTPEYANAYDISAYSEEDQQTCANNQCTNCESVTRGCCASGTGGSCM